MFRLTTLRAAAALAVLGAMALAGCGGGGSQTLMPAAQGATAPRQRADAANAKRRHRTNGHPIDHPSEQDLAQAQSARPRGGLYVAKKPTYIDTTTAELRHRRFGHPAERSGSRAIRQSHVCYNLYTDGTLAPANAAERFTYTNRREYGHYRNARDSRAAGDRRLPDHTVRRPMRQHAVHDSGGAGGSHRASNILAQTPVTYADIEPGVVNNLNNQIANCAGIGTASTFRVRLVLDRRRFRPTAMLAASSRSPAFTSDVPDTESGSRARQLHSNTARANRRPDSVGGERCLGCSHSGTYNGRQPARRCRTVPIRRYRDRRRRERSYGLYLIDATTGAIAQGPRHQRHDSRVQRPRQRSGPVRRRFVGLCAADSCRLTRFSAASPVIRG